jgi:hypothetical protein
MLRVVRLQSYILLVSIPFVLVAQKDGVSHSQPPPGEPQVSTSSIVNAMNIPGVLQS